MVLEQCEDRAFRIGQTKEVDVTYNDTPYTLDDCMRWINESKAANASIVLSDSVALSDTSISFRDMSGFLGKAIRLLRKQRRVMAEAGQDAQTDGRSVDELLRSSMSGTRLEGRRNWANFPEQEGDDTDGSDDDSSCDDDSEGACLKKEDNEDVGRPSSIVSASASLSPKKVKKERKSPTGVMNFDKLYDNDRNGPLKKEWDCPRCNLTNYSASDTTAVCNRCNYHRLIVKREGDQEIIVID